MAICKLTVTKEDGSSRYNVFCSIDVNPDRPIYTNSSILDTIDYLVGFKEMNPQLEVSIDIQVPAEAIATSLRAEVGADDGEGSQKP